jgi:hypothetical protein
MTAPAPSPELDQAVETPKRSKRIYVLWVCALTLLLGLGLVCWLVVPFLRTRNVLAECRDGQLSRKNALAALGGPEKAAEALGHYLEATDRIRPGNGDPDYYYREVATEMLGMCGKHGIPMLERMVIDDQEMVGKIALEELWGLAQAKQPQEVRQAAAEALKGFWPAFRRKRQ